MIFRETTMAPIDRQMNCNVDNQGVENILTLGACSYISHAVAEFDRSAELGGYHPSHILIGRYSSLAGGMNVLMAFNHSYKGATSTFPFEDRPRMKKIISQTTLNFSDYDYPENFRARENRHQLIIGHDVWIGYGVFFVGGVNVGNGAVIGANAVVAKDIPPYAIAVGNPARVIKYRFDEETIKKLLAVKWWNWSFEKILANCKYMKDAEKFLAAHYSPELETFPEDEFSRRLKDIRERGNKIYQFIPDFRAENPLWSRIVEGFCQSDFKNSLLVIWLDANTEKYFELLAKTVSRFDNDAGKNILVVESDETFSPAALRKATHFITTREMSTLEALDYLRNTDVKIISALDDGIFDGEPTVNWKQLLSK